MLDTPKKENFIVVKKSQLFWVKGPIVRPSKPILLRFFKNWPFAPGVSESDTFQVFEILSILDILMVWKHFGLQFQLSLFLWPEFTWFEETWMKNDRKTIFINFITIFSKMSKILGQNEQNGDQKPWKMQFFHIWRHWSLGTSLNGI